MDQFPGLRGWKRSACLGCGHPVIAARHAHVLIGGRRDGTAIFAIGLEPHLLKAEEPDALYRGELFLLGVAHRSCVAHAREALRSGRVALPSDLPVMKAAEIEELPEQFHEPPTARTCAFCISEDKLTDEHVWPKWISRVLRQRAGVADRDRPFVMMGDRKRRTRLIDVTAPVCEACNNRWLATLEKDSRAILAPMVIGRSRTLDQSEQLVTATWAVKTALMFDLSSGPEAIIPLGYYREFAQRRAPLPSMCVWIAGYAGPAPAWATRKALWVDISPEEHPNAFVITLVAGALVLQIAGHFVKSASIRDRRWQFADCTRLIWPTVFGTIPWPPGRAVPDNDALAEFASSFGGSELDQE